MYKTHPRFECINYCKKVRLIHAKLRYALYVKKQTNYGLFSRWVLPHNPLRQLHECRTTTTTTSCLANISSSFFIYYINKASKNTLMHYMRKHTQNYRFFSRWVLLLNPLRQLLECGTTTTSLSAMISSSIFMYHINKDITNTLMQNLAKYFF